jgi:hypothetical protein
LWLGSRHGPRASPIVITQDTPAIPGRDEPGDQFGAVIEVGHADSDGFADMIIAAPGENEGAGRVAVIRGGRDGFATAGNSSFDQDSPNVPGRPAPGAAFGSTLALLDLTADSRPDLAVAARGERANARVMVIEGGRGVFAPGETRTTILSGAAQAAARPDPARARLHRLTQEGTG